MPAWEDRTCLGVIVTPAKVVIKKQGFSLGTDAEMVLTEPSSLCLSG
jgi:hypothetical protein